MPKVDSLIRTKLRLPFTRPGLVSRPRLQEQIAQGLCGPITLITAPAGFGKTTLVASGVSHSGMPAAWLSLDKNDNPTGRFLSYLVAALHEAEATIGGEAAQLLAASPAVPPETLLTSLINDLDAARKEMVLVLDDYQFISSPAVHEAMAFFLEHSPATLHLVIATRSDPPLPLARLRARGQIVELRAADLRFTESEAVQFLNDVMGLHLDAASVAVLEERTEGWIAGLQMAALSMRGREDVDSFLRAFAGTNRFIMDFMLEEVLAREPEEVQAFLLQTAVLTRLTGPLCDALTGASGGQAMLEGLERRNLFVVPLDDDRRWYRYHHLFADLLQARLYQSGPERAAQLQSRAAEWCEQDGQAGDAVSYALAARDYARAADLIAKYWSTVANDGDIETVWSWLKVLPEETMKNSAPLSAAYCWMLWLTAQMDPIEAHLVDADRAFGELVAREGGSADDPAYAGLCAELAVLHSIVARYHEDFETASALGERALELLPRNLPPQTDAQLRSLMYLALASAYDGAGDMEKAVGAYAESIRLSAVGANLAGMGITFRLIGALRLLGRLRAADEACREALRHVQAQGMDRLPATGILHLALSEVLAERNELEAAEAQLSQAMELGKRSGRLDPVKNAAYVLTRLRLAHHDAAGALRAIQEAEAAIGEPPPPLARTELLALKARVLVRQGALTEAAQCAQEATRLAGRDRGQTRQLAELAACRVLAARSKPDEAVTQLTEALAAAEAGGRRGVAIELRILRSLALARRGDTREAEADLERALALAEPEGYMRVFLDEGQPMQRLLAQWLARAEAGPLRGYATGLLSRFDREPPALPAAQETASPAGELVEPLSQREREVLQLMALGKTNPQIARQLIVAPGTVKAHTASIYRKLDVANRTEAVARAREIGILR